MMEKYTATNYGFNRGEHDIGDLGTKFQLRSDIGRTFSQD